MLRLILIFLLAATAPAAAGERLTVPTPQAAVDRMVELAEIQPGDKIYDLGCGDGAMLVGLSLKAGTPMSYVAIEGEFEAVDGEDRYNLQLSGRMMF